MVRLEPSIEKRPILASKPEEERRQFIVDHLAQREKFYKQADIIVEVDGKTVSEIADEIIAQASK
jgi:shikimate kinase